MKSMIYPLLIAVFVSGLWAGPARAEGPDKEDRKGKREEMGKKFKEKLGLTDDQVEKMKAARKAHQDAVKPLRDTLKQGMEKLRTQIKDKAVDSEIQTTLNQLDQSRKALQAENENHKKNVAAILTPTQQAKKVLGMMGHKRGEWKGHKKDGKEDDGD